MTRQQPHYPQPWIDSHMFSILSLSKNHSLAQKNIHSIFPILHLIHHVMIPFAFSSFDASTHRLFPPHPPHLYHTPPIKSAHTKFYAPLFPFVYGLLVLLHKSDLLHSPPLRTHTHTMHIKILTGSMLCLFSAGWKDKYYSFT